MYASISDVDEITGVSVDLSTLKKAQAVIETASGRPEELVTDTTDLIWLKKATAYQCAYMEEDPTSVFEQPNLESYSHGDDKMVVGDKPLWLAPMAQKAIGNLSWHRSRVVSSEPFNYRKELWRQDMQTAWMRDRWWNW
ncbi:hypothetical protein [Streptomyces griseorubiginosus]|uniref:hypothetical protein n=1 Tax=Streptomyces griseorubiginosus TaxID=67304 RepID=UPI002E8044E4|nr:hypothetical protein [Streptomyces griseorubiginosus]WUB44572.1 hypothetical protein OHN19_14985 [Streptomyces griseorubiginosus]WUB53089.1 hypothetical protein OG942_14980 [Streptomyces griseorubiginosus]